MYDTQIKNELRVKVRENLQLTNTDKKPLPACQYYSSILAKGAIVQTVISPHVEK